MRRGEYLQFAHAFNREGVGREGGTYSDLANGGSPSHMTQSHMSQSHMAHGGQLGLAQGHMAQGHMAQGHMAQGQMAQGQMGLAQSQMALSQEFEDYEGSPWRVQRVSEDTARLLMDFGCELFDIYRPVRDPKYVASELGDSVLCLSHTEILKDLSCYLCKGLCKEAMTVKECCHRFCNDCIQKWLRSGKQTCPQCVCKIPSRRVLRADKNMDLIIQRLFPDLEPLQHFDRTRSRESVEASSAESGEPELTSSSSPLPSEDEEEEESVEEESEDDVSLDEDEELPTRAKRGRPKGSTNKKTIIPRVIPPIYNVPTMEEMYADDSGCLEIFLVCLNHNLPTAVCSMARELSKRPMKLAVGATTRDAAMILAEKLVRDVLGPFDVHSIVTDLSFVRDGEIWPAVSDAPLSEVCRQVTESRGPIALRYLLSDRLFSLCERIEAAY
ncbi:ring finger protein [Gregarina niphandrodes]|uniref:Ring finger protein n=1 Tax=Gregarina niphandrodes TaxID=110365 RepID=A0A023BD48_GRENI|nr:ring finger protein [Gregarina niphandrodes]EZG86205.1 ring finger protein [Gregarina niphandrodes]|eukprot:XP_011128773.1 ring finger protein [Gregarina niphandrodes]